MDEHVHRSITVGLRLRGIDVLTVQDNVDLTRPFLLRFDNQFAGQIKQVVLDLFQLGELLAAVVIVSNPTPASASLSTS